MRPFSWIVAGLFLCGGGPLACAQEVTESSAGPPVAATRAAVADDGPAIAEIPPSATPVRRLAAPPGRGGFAPNVPSAGANRFAADIDPNDNVERVLILAPGGPIVLQLTLFLDDKPFRQTREALVDDLMKQADTDQDGTATWDEALRNPRFLAARGFAVMSAEQREKQRVATTAAFDANRDGRVDRAEARNLLRQYGGAEFQTPSYFSGGLRPEILPLLDLDRDGGLSAEEIARAPGRLQSRDANGDDLLESNEADRLVAQGAARTSNALPLGRGMNAAAIRSALRSRYGRDGRIVAEGMPLFPHLLEGLDRNANGELDEDEMAGFDAIRPHIAATIRLTTRRVGDESPTPSIRVTWLASEFVDRAALGRDGPEARLAVPGATLSIFSPAAAVLSGGFKTQSESLVARYDIDKNGYLDKTDFEGQAGREALSSQLEVWDDDGDGKVYAKEIEASYDRQAAPLNTQVHVASAELGSGLFGLLDPSGDGRLSAREMRTAAARLRTLDADADGRLSGGEIATEIQLHITRGGQGYAWGGGQAVLRDGRVVSPAVSSNRPAAGPKWFQHMDRNGDGDVTLKEFLGDAARFKSLDKNNDGFLEPAEAAAATSPAP